MTEPHRHRSFALSGWTCTAAACGRLQDAGIDPSPFSQRELVLLWLLLPPGTLTSVHDLVPVVALTAHALQALVSRTRGALEPQGFAILSSKTLGYGLVRVTAGKAIPTIHEPATGEG